MIAANPLDIHWICKSVQSTFENWRKHWSNCLDVIDVREKDAEQVLEQSLIRRQLIICQCPQKICEILISMKAYPINAIIQHHTWRYDFLRKILRIDATPLQFLEIDATLFEDVDWIHGLVIGFDVKIEIELPCGDWLGELTIFIWESDADLDQLQAINVLLDP